MKELEIKITWENENLFKMEGKDEGGEWMTVVEVHENAMIKEIWDQVLAICAKFFRHHMDEIGKEMKT